MSVFVSCLIVDTEFQAVLVAVDEEATEATSKGATSAGRRTFPNWIVKV